MLHRFFRFVGSLTTHVCEELLDYYQINSRPEPTIGTINNLEEKKELPTIKLD